MTAFGATADKERRVALIAFDATDPTVTLTTGFAVMHNAA
jgi:hypothetical protein